MTGLFTWLGCLLLGGCLRDVNADGVVRIGVAGDSNSYDHWWTGSAATLLSHGPVVNGGTVVDEPIVWVSEAESGTSCQEGFGQLVRLVDDGVDVVIIAFGTNDLRAIYQQTPEEVAACYHRLSESAAPAGLKVLVATTPPIIGTAEADLDDNMLIDKLNRLVRTEFPYVIEFHDGFTQEMFVTDGVHLNQKGVALRAERAVAALSESK